MSILLVEDDLKFVRLIEGQIKKAMDFCDTSIQIVKATTGDEAWKILTGMSDLGFAILDIKLPGEYSGFDIWQKISDAFPDVTTVVVSAHMSDDMGELFNNKTLGQFLMRSDLMKYTMIDKANDMQYLLSNHFVGYLISLIEGYKFRCEARRYLLNCKTVADTNKTAGDFMHNLSNTLSFVFAVPDLFLSERENDKEIKNCRQVIGRCKKLVAYIQKILKNGSGVEFFSVDISARELLREVVADYAFVCETEKIQFELELGDKDIVFKGYKIFLHEALCNLIHNAIDSLRQKTMEDKKISLGMGTTGGCVELYVSDNGIGWSGEYNDKIFRPDFSLKKSYGAHYGMGLPYVKSVVEHHNGYITALSNQGDGAEFIIRLPICKNS